MHPWASQAVFYHIYPLGLTGAPQRNDFNSPPAARLNELYPWLDQMQALGCNALYLGPVFESSAHGYDTADYYRVDRRLGSNADLSAFSAELHQRGMRLVLDAVFNHVGRDFWAFRDLQTYRQESAYRDWFRGLRFDQSSPYGDPFAYEGWAGNYDLVRLNTDHPDVRQHLLDAAALWVREFNIDGLRLDAADCLEFGFLRELAAFCRSLRPDFWLMGEVVHGDYRAWVNPQTLDSVTNYECYKGLYSSFNDRNMFEIAYSLNRQFGQGGIYEGQLLYNFADNHDVDRLASRLANPAHLYPAYALLFGMPGIPSIYYGSETGLAGQRSKYSDRELRPSLRLDALRVQAPQPDLPAAIARLARVRAGSPALQRGDYRPLAVSAQQLAFSRSVKDEQVLVLVNAEDRPAEVPFDLPGAGRLVDLLNPPETFAWQGGRARVDVPAHWARILRVER